MGRAQAIDASATAILGNHRGIVPPAVIVIIGAPR